MINIKKKMVPFISSLVLLLSFVTIVSADINFVVDDANLLSSEEEQQLREDLASFKEQYNMDAVIVTSNDLGGKSQMDYADDYFDYNGYGVGEDKSGLLLLIDMDDRKVWISTSGEAIKYFTDSRIQDIVDDITTQLKNADYFEGCNEFINDINYYAEEGIPAGQYTYNEAERTQKVIFIGLGAGLIVASVVSLLVVNSYKNSKSISTANYVDSNSIVFTRKKDRFISTYTSKTKIERNNSSSGGSSTHTSSSGNTHGGGGGSF